MNLLIVNEAVIFSILLFSFLIFSIVAVNGQTVNSVKIFSPDAKPFGLSYEEHAQNYWKWLLSLPVDVGHIKIKTGKNVGMVK